MSAYAITAANVKPSAYAQYFVPTPSHIRPAGSDTPIPNVCIAGENITAGDKLAQGIDDLWYRGKAVPMAPQTSGTLTVGKRYVITDFNAGDDFANVGAVNETGAVFAATGTTPTTWTNASILNEADPLYNCDGVAAHSVAKGQPINVVVKDPFWTPGCTLAKGDVVIGSSGAGEICEAADKASGWYVSSLGVAFSTTQMDLNITSSGVAR